MTATIGLKPSKAKYYMYDIEDLEKTLEPLI